MADRLGFALELLLRCVQYHQDIIDMCRSSILFLGFECGVWIMLGVEALEPQALRL